VVGVIQRKDAMEKHKIAKMGEAKDGIKIYNGDSLAKPLG